MALTDKQQAFVAHYLTCWNATQAALLAGYSERSAGAIGHENLKKPEIAEEIKKRVAALTLTANETLVRMSEQARGIPDDCFQVIGGLIGVDFERLKERGLLHLIKKITYDKDGRPQVEFYDAQASLFKLAQHHGLLVDRTEVSGPDGGAIEQKHSGAVSLDLSSLSTDQLRAIVAGAENAVD